MSTVALLLWLALPPLALAVLGRHYLSRCRAELDQARSYVDDTYEDIDDLLTRTTGQPEPQPSPPAHCHGRHRLRT